MVLSGVQVDVQEENLSVENESSTLSQSNVTPQKNRSTYICNVCKISVDTFITLQLHQKKDHPLHPYMCNIQTCGSMYKMWGGLKKHLVKHDIASPVRCNTCQVIFPSVEKRWTTSVHRVRQINFNVILCVVTLQTNLMTNTDMSQHVRIIQRDKLYVTPVVSFVMGKMG